MKSIVSMFAPVNISEGIAYWTVYVSFVRLFGIHMWEDGLKEKGHHLMFPVILAVSDYSTYVTYILS